MESIGNIATCELEEQCLTFHSRLERFRELETSHPNQSLEWNANGWVLSDCEMGPHMSGCNGPSTLGPHPFTPCEHSIIFYDHVLRRPARRSSASTIQIKDRDFAT